MPANLVAMIRIAGGRRLLTSGGVLALMTVAALLSGCVQSYPIGRAPAGDPIDAAKALSDAPAPVRTGDAKKACGAFVLAQGQTLPSDAVDCLEAAVSNRDAAELAWSVPTTEGDPIVSFAFVTPSSGAVTVYSTNAFDSYGGDPGWTQRSCSDPMIATSLAGCAAP